MEVSWGEYQRRRAQQQEAVRRCWVSTVMERTLRVTRTMLVYGTSVYRATALGPYEEAMTATEVRMRLEAGERRLVPILERFWRRLVVGMMMRDGWRRLQAKRDDVAAWGDLS